MSLDELDLRIVGALQIDPRASWRQIAQALGESPSTVTRRGSAMLQAKTVRIGAITEYEANAWVVLGVAPGRADEIARVVTDVASANFVALVSPPTRVIIEESLAREDVDQQLLARYAAIPGVTSVDISPVLAYHRTSADWMTDVLTPAEREQLRTEPVARSDNARPPRTPEELALVAALRKDGRIPLGQVAKLVGASESGARRILSSLLSQSVRIRAVTDDTAVGYPEAAWLQLVVEPGGSAAVVEQLLAESHVRYVAHAMGDYQLVVELIAESVPQLNQLITQGAWTQRVVQMNVSQPLAVYVRGGQTLA